MKIIYIVGCGRSGSTILDLLLNTLPGAWTVGEANVLPFELEVDRQTCGCGKSVLSCLFWREVCEGLDGDVLSPESGVSYFRETHSAEKIVRPKRITRFLRKRGTPKTEKHTFCSTNKAFFERVEKVASRRRDVRFVVDASKSFYRACWLAECEKLDVRFVHLTKDPRAFVYSKTKGMKGVRGLLQAVRDSIRYVVENWLDAKLVERLPEYRAMHVRYEDLATEPDKVIKKIAERFELRYAPVAEKFREVENHGVAGNASRMRGGKIRLDEKWKTKLPRSRHVITTVITYLFARRFDYYR